MNGSGQSVLRTGVGAVRLGRDVVVVQGSDADSYLQGQVSQDIGDLRPGRSLWSLVLEPQGKVDAWFRMTRGADGILLDLEAGWGEALIARLERFRLRVDVTFELLDWSMVALRGPASKGVATDSAAIVVPVDWAGLPGLDLLGPQVEIPGGATEVEVADLEAVRIEAGVPRLGHDLTAGMIPAEAGVVDGSVSFTKGCYTGQELVARIDSRGNNTPRRLRGLILDGSAPPAAGTVVRDADGEVGQLTSAAYSEHLGRPVALALLGRRVDEAAEVTVGESAARVAPLPLVAG